MINLFILFFLPLSYSCYITPCNVTLQIGCPFFSQALSLLPYSISYSCAYLNTKYICTAASVQQLINTSFPSFPQEDCQRLRYCFTDSSILLPLCSNNPTLIMPNNTLVYDNPVMPTTPCPKLDRFASPIDVKFILGEAYYYVNLSYETTLTINPLPCSYDSLAFNDSQGRDIFIGFMFFFFTIFLLSILYICLSSLSPIKERGILLQLLNNAFLTLSLWSLLEIDMFGYSSRCSIILLFANLSIPLLGVINLVKAFQLYFVYSWQMWRLNNKGSLPTSSLIYRCRLALTYKGTLFLLLLFSFPVLIIFVFILSIFTVDLSGPIGKTISCPAWLIPPLHTLTPYPPVVPDLNSCALCSFSGNDTHAIPTLVVVCTINFILLLVLYKIRKMQDHYYIWLELFSVTFFNVAIYPICAASIYPNFYNLFLDYKNKIITPSALISALVCFNVLVSTVMPIYKAIANRNKVQKMEKENSLNSRDETVTIVTYIDSQQSQARNNGWTQEGLIDKLKDENFYHNLLEHCQRRFEGDLFHCLISMIEEKKESNVQNRYLLGKNIFNMYIKTDSPLFIDILSPFEQSLEKAYKDLQTFMTLEQWEYAKAFDILSNYIVKNM